MLNPLVAQVQLNFNGARTNVDFGTVGTGHSSFNLTPIGGTPPYTFNVTGPPIPGFGISNPANVLNNGSVPAFIGVATAPGVYVTTIQLKDARNNTISKTATFIVKADGMGTGGDSSQTGGAGSASPSSGIGGTPPQTRADASGTLTPEGILSILQGGGHLTAAETAALFGFNNNVTPDALGQTFKTLVSSASSQTDSQVSSQLDSQLASAAISALSMSAPGVLRRSSPFKTNRNLNGMLELWPLTLGTSAAVNDHRHALQYGDAVDIEDNISTLGLLSGHGGSSLAFGGRAEGGTFPMLTPAPSTVPGEIAFDRAFTADQVGDSPKTTLVHTPEPSTLIMLSLVLGAVGLRMGRTRRRSK
jgi:hypothetical protein